MRLTLLGRVVLIVGGVSLVLGIVAGLVPLLAIGTFSLVLVALASSIVAEVPQIEVRRQAVPPEVPRGGPASIHLDIRSTTTKRPRPLTVIESVQGEQRVASIPPLAGGETFELTYPLNTSKRGVQVSGPLVARRFDPFGLITADKQLSDTVSVSVRPRLRDLRILPSGRQRDLEGPTRERSEGSAAFHQLREYAPGDDLRRVHWPSTARYGDLLVKQMVDTTRPELVILLDNRTSAIGDDDFEQAVEIAASIAHAAVNEDFPVLLLFSDGDNETALDGQQIPHYDRLTGVQRSDTDSLSEMASALRARGRSMVMITGDLSGRDLVLVNRLMHGFSPRFLVSVVAERRSPVVAPPGTRTLACRDADEFLVHWKTIQ
jgi:uncharacterized protein (DUF58 family)